MSEIALQTDYKEAAYPKQRICWVHWAAGIALVLVLLFSSHSFQFLFASDVTGGLAKRPSARENPAYAAVFLLQLSLFALVIFNHVLKNSIRMPLLVAAGYCCFVLGSIFWSVSPNTTLVPGILFSYLVMAAYATSTVFTPTQFLRIYFYLCLVILIASFFLLIIGSPNAGQARYGGGWLTALEFSGVMASKNFAGLVFASATILSINGNYIGIPGVIRLAVFLMGIVAIALSNSATAVLAFVLLLIPSLLFHPARTGWQKALFGMLIVFAILIPSLPFISAGDALSILGRDATFTGRTYLWEVAFEEFLNYPAFGHGYYAFFDTDSYSPVWNLWERFRYFLADNFHNSFVDILVSLGIVGVVVMIGTAMRAAMIVGNSSIDAGARICLGLQLCVFLIGSLMEFAIFHHNYIATFFLFYVLFASMWQYNDNEARS